MWDVPLVVGCVLARWGTDFQKFWLTSPTVEVPSGSFDESVLEPLFPYC
jgi:hypothetical protein